MSNLVSKGRTIRKTARLRPETDNLLKEYARKNHMTENGAMDKILYDCLSTGLTDGNEIQAQHISDLTVQKIKRNFENSETNRELSLYPKAISGLSNRLNSIEENVEILVEMMDALFAYEGYSGITESRTQAYTKAKIRVQKRHRKMPTWGRHVKNE